MNFFLTGRPGIGKTTVLRNAMKTLSDFGYKAGGVYCPEIRVKGVRLGFEIIDIMTEKRGILAHIDQPTGPRVSRYRVNLKNLSEIGAAAIDRALIEGDYIVIDEVGPMELYSNEFGEAVLRAVEDPKPILGVIHWKMQHPLVRMIKSRKDVKVHEVTFNNRKTLHSVVVKEVLESIRGIKR